MNRRRISAPAGLLVALLLAGSLLPPVEANPPQSVTLEYDAASGQLNVTIGHFTLNGATHYIFKVVVERNSVVNLTANYASQPTNNIFTYTYNITAVDGDTLRATASCILGGDASGSVTVSVAPPPDLILPLVDIVNPGNLQVFNTSNIVVNGTASDNVALAKVELSLNNGTWATASGTTDWSSPLTLVLGPNFIRARATDTSNNTNQDFVYVTLINDTGPQPDTTPPSIMISAPLESQTINVSAIEIRGNASDNAGVRLVEVRLNGGAWTEAAGNTTWSSPATLALGANLVEARATDTSSNTATTSVNVTYRNETGPPPDTVRPSITIDQPSEGQKFNVTAADVSGTASDNAGLNKVWVRVNSGAWGLATGKTAWNSSVTLVKGGNLIEAVAYDTSGNTATAMVNVTYAAPPPPVDTTLPAIAISAPAEGTIFTSASITVNGNASDNVKVDRVEVRLGAGAWTAAAGNLTWTATLTLAEGKNVIEARAFDPAGNSKNASVTVYYTKPGNAATLDGSISSGEYDLKATFSGGDFELHWKVSGGVIRMAMVGRTSGWVAIGLQPTLMMQNADMIIGWVDSKGKPGILDCHAPDPTTNHPPDTSFSPPGTFDILEYGGTQSGGVTTMEFTRLLKTDDRYDNDIPQNGTLRFIWGLGPDDNIGNIHQKVGYGSVNITTGASTEKAPMAWQPHAVLMGFGMGLLAAGMFVARMKKQKWWLKDHRAVMLAGAALTVSGLAYGFYMIQDSTGVHYRVLHSYLGLLSILLTASMAASGLVLLKIAKNHPAARPAHRWLGRATLLVLLVTVLMGLVQAGVIALG